MSKFYAVLTGGLLSALALGAGPAAGQNPVVPIRRCVTEEVNSRIQEELKRLNPGYNKARSTNQPAPTTLRTGAVTYTLPVIVHVIHNGEAVGTGYNINALQIKSQLDVLNEDYRNTNADGALAPSIYQPVRADMQVQFTPAKYDPSGNLLAEPGIDRVNRNAKGFTAPPYGTANGDVTYIDDVIKPATSWDPSRYINIWVMDINGGILGYAQFPDNTANLGGLNAIGGLAATDGVVIAYTAYGSRAKYPAGNYGSGTNPYDKGRTLSHELGHWFSLRHIWADDNRAAGGTCSGSDYVSDTPNQAIQNFGCVTFPHVTCSNTGDMSMNYMDYSDDACLYMFTQGQKDRLQAVMVNTPRRGELATSTVGCPGLVAAAASNSGAACAGTSITLAATGPAGATYAWTGPNNFTSNQQNPTLTNVTTAMAGEYLVKVSVTTGACANFASTTVVVNPAPPVPVLAPSASTVCPGSPATLLTSGLAAGALPRENFNGTATGWTLTNSGTATTGWQYRTSPYTYGTGLSNFSIDGTPFLLANSDIGGSGSVTNTTVTSPVFSTNGYSSLTLTFQHYLRYVSGDVATVEVTTNGGATWTAAAAYGATQGSAASPATATVNLNAYINQAAVQVRWRYTTSWAWYWAFDNVAFSGTPATPAYTWSVVSGDGLPTPANTANLVVTPTQNSVYRLTVAFNGIACTSTSTVSVNVYPTPALATSVSTACAGSAAVLSATNLAGFSPTYAWSLVSGDGLPTVTNTPTLSVTPTQNSVYRLTVTYPGSCSQSSTVSVAVVPTPALVASASVICVGSTSQLSATNIPATGYTYAWSVVSGDGLPATTNTPTITVNPTQNSVYRLTVSSGACSTSSTVAVAAVTNTITAYPVPFGDAGLSLRVSTCTAGPASVQIYDIVGRRVYDSVVSNPQAGVTTINIAETARLRPGKYVVKVQQGSQATSFNVVRQ